jgi:hypothetical protein
VAPDEALAVLRPAERARLDAFARAFDRVAAEQYPSFTETAPGPEVATAQQHAIERLSSDRRRKAVRAAVEAFVDAGSQAYSRRTSMTDVFLLFQSLPDRAEDRVRFLASVERAVVGLVLWDELDPDDRAALVGPWSSYLEGLGIG